MTTTYKQAIENTPVTKLTENGMPTYESSLNAHTDLFFQYGALRRDPARAVQLFAAAYRIDKILAVKIALYARDIRGGSGERGIFRAILQWLETQGEFEMLAQVIPHVPTFGRWDDLLVLTPQTRNTLCYPQIAKALRDNNGLCAKWMPRKGEIAVELRTHMNLSPKAYRKMLVTLTKVVESLMCAGQWDAIEYDHVPSVASKIYQKAFGRHSPTGYTLYKEKLVKGEAKVNADTLYPYDCIVAYRNGDPVVAAAQWDALPNFLGDNRILPVIDTSGSMTWFQATTSCTGADVAQSLGLYCATKQTGAFKDIVFSFNTTPKAVVLDGATTFDKYQQMFSIPVGGSTNIQACFELILKIAKKNDVPASEMPAYIIIFSDMQFNSCTDDANETGYEMIKRKFAEAGYDLPKVVFWNLDGRNRDVPVTFNQAGVALVSGFAPSIMTAILAGGTFTPVGIMMQAVGIDRYNVLGKPASTQEGELAHNQAYAQAMRLV